MPDSRMASDVAWDSLQQEFIALGACCGSALNAEPRGERANYLKYLGSELRQRLAQARERNAARLVNLGIMPWIMPRGGFYLCCRLPDGLDFADIARHCLEAGVVLAPGNVFSVSQSAGPFHALQRGAI